MMASATRLEDEATTEDEEFEGRPDEIKALLEDGRYTEQKPFTTLALTVSSKLFPFPTTIISSPY